MSKTIEQLRAEASIIEEATRQGENTQLRVGGLFQDIIDFIAQIPISETILGPLLQALNNSGLINPGDGQTLTFSLMKDGWTFSDALTQFQLKLGQISSTVTSNYEAFIQTRDMLQREVEATDQRVRSYKTDYDNSQIEYATWKSQTDTSISQYAVAIDKVSGDIISISGRVDTAYDQLDFVTNNLEAADKALEKLFNLTGLDYEDPEEAYTASWLYKNRQGIYGAAATFDENGNILQGSVLATTVEGIEADVRNVDGRYSTLSIKVDSIETRVGNAEGTYSQILQDIQAINLIVSDPNTGIGALNIKANSISGQITSINGTMGRMELSIEQRVTYDELGNKIEQEFSKFEVDANKIRFTNFEGWTIVNDEGDVIFRLSPNNVYIRGTVDALGITYAPTYLILKNGETWQMADNGGTYVGLLFDGSGNATVKLPVASYYNKIMLVVYVFPRTAQSSNFTINIRSHEGGNIQNMQTGTSDSSITASSGDRMEFYCSSGQWQMFSKK